MKKQEINLKKIEKAVCEILEAVGEDVTREGLKETPERVARMYQEIFAGINYSNHEIAIMFDKCFPNESSDIVVIKDIPTFSYCEHHMALMYNLKVSVGYIPDGKVIGLSKIPRIVDMVCRRLQLQERIGKDIFEILSEVLGTANIIVRVKGEHACMRARGIKMGQAPTLTCYSGGLFKNYEKKEEFLQLCSFKKVEQNKKEL